MLIFNTTYQVEESVHDNFMIWMKECFIVEVQNHGALTHPRLCKLLGQHNDDSDYTYCLQWEVESSEILHHWYMEVGSRLNDEQSKIFKDKVLGFSTLLEVIE